MLEQALVTTWYRVVYSVVLEALVEVVIQTYVQKSWDPTPHVQKLQTFKKGVRLLLP